MALIDTSDSLSVLIIDEEPGILAFFARILDVNNIRALLARSSAEAIGIAKRSYVPIDLVLSNVMLRPDPELPEITSASDLVDRLRQLRPRLRALYMSALVDSEVIRIDLMDRGMHHLSKNSGHAGLIDAIRGAAGNSAPLVRRAGGN